MIGLDVGNVLVNLYKFWKEDREIQAWAVLFISTAYSAFIAFTGAAGATLLARKGYAFALGSGLLASSVAVLGVILKSPKAKTLMLSIPQTVVEEYQKAGEATIYPVEEKK